MKKICKKIKKIFSSIWKLITIVGGLLVIVFVFFGKSLLPFLSKEKANNKIKKEVNIIKRKTNELKGKVKNIEKENKDILNKKTDRDKKAKKYFPNLDKGGN